MSDDMWGGMDVIPLSPINPFDPNDSPELHDAWEKQAAAERAEAKRIHERTRLAAETDSQLLRMRGRAAAQDTLRAEAAASAPMPELVGLDKLLAEDDDPVHYRVSRLWPRHGRVILAAQFKAGKTTLRDNLVRALADNQPFLGRYEVTPITGTIIVFDTELNRNTMRRWLRAQNIINTNRIIVVPMRGQVGTFDLRDPHTRTRWAQIIRDHDGQIIILDCLAPLLDAFGIDPNREAGQFLNGGIDPLLEESGITEALITHHMGHVAERSRGDSRLRDWPDVEWRLVREKEDDEGVDIDPAAPRYLTAYGRDVDVPESQLTYDPDTKEIIIVGGNRRDRLMDLVIDAVKASPGITANTLCTQIVAQKAKVLDARDRAVRARFIRTEKGPNRAQFHYSTDPVVPVVPGSSDAPVVSGSTPFRENHHRTPPPPAEILGTTPGTTHTDPMSKWAANLYDRE